VRWRALVAAATTATAQTAPPSDQLHEIVITGSLIKRTDIETPSPVQIITDVDLKNSGYQRLGGLTYGGGCRIGVQHAASRRRRGPVLLARCDL